MEIEADRKHVPQLLEDLIEADAIENSPIFEGEQATLFRRGTMRCAYLAQDRVDISETIKYLARAISKPRTGHMMQLKRVARYLKRSAKEGAAVPRTGAEQSTLGSAHGQ